MFKLFACTASVLATISLMGCGSKDTGRVGLVGAASGKAAPSGAASAEQVAKEMRGNVRCPATASTPTPAGGPVDDVTGVRPGMSWDEAANFVLCDNPLLVATEVTSRGFNINTYGQHIRQGFEAKFAEARTVKSSKQILRDMEEQAMRRSGNAYVAPLQPGQSRYYVSTMGQSGQEKVVTVAREEYFPQGKLPTVDSVKQALIAKYGEPSQINANGQTTYFWWEYDPSGGKVSQDSQRHGQCWLTASPDAGTSLSDDCGVQVGALIQGDRENAGLAHSLAVTSQNGTMGLALVNQTESALRQMSDTQKSRQLSEAEKNGTRPKL